MRRGGANLACRRVNHRVISKIGDARPQSIGAGKDLAFRPCVEHLGHYRLELRIFRTARFALLRGFEEGQKRFFHAASEILCLQQLSGSLFAMTIGVGQRLSQGFVFRGELSVAPPLFIEDVHPGVEIVDMDRTPAGAILGVLPGVEIAQGRLFAIAKATPVAISKPSVSPLE